MADGWDLHAVVRGCTTATTPINGHIVNNEEDPLPELASLTLKNDDIPFHYPGFAENTNFQFQGLEEIYKNFLPQPQPQPQPISPSSAIPVLGGLQNQHRTQLVPPPQQLIQPRFKNSRAGSSLTLPTFLSQTVRSRRSKNQQKKLVSQMTQEELLADSWAWRKYGQKPIKGSAYPRNYYKCSTSKGCAARKQVEKSPSDPNIYVVSYTGDHTHPRPPTHRNSVAGSTRNKLSSTVTKPTPSDTSEALPATVFNPSCSSSSPVSASSFSPITPFMEGESTPHKNSQSGTLNYQNDDVDAEMEDTENDEVYLIPNEVLTYE